MHQAPGIAFVTTDQMLQALRLLVVYLHNGVELAFGGLTLRLIEAGVKDAYYVPANTFFAGSPSNTLCTRILGSLHSNEEQEKILVSSYFCSSHPPR